MGKENSGHLDELSKEDQESAIDNVLDDVDEDILDEQREEKDDTDQNNNDSEDNDNT